MATRFKREIFFRWTHFQSLGLVLIAMLILGTSCRPSPMDAEPIPVQDPDQQDKEDVKDLEEINPPSAESDQKNELALQGNDEPDEYVEPPGYDPNRQTIEIPDSWKRLSLEQEIWLDAKTRRVIVAGEVCLDMGQLEMFICPLHTKEHESVITVNALASQVHAALVSMGINPGKPTSSDPEYRAAHGPVIEITLMWHDEKTDKVRSESAHQWVRNTRTGTAMTEDWVFGGSRFWVDPETKESFYYGDAGEFICLSNFPTATIDLNVESSRMQESLLFEAFTENIPPVGTKVYAILKPGKRIGPETPVEKKGDPGSEPAADKTLSL